MRILIGGLGVLLAGLIVWAIVAGDFGAAGEFLFAKPWGIVSMADLYLGFVLATVVIVVAEADKRVALAWVVPIFVLGNVVTALWFALRGLPRLRARFRNAL
uniref:hypothetical protein n=1 Tax=Pararhizobium sp. IMCC3301 TaxID=3067904 RepID=UPI0027419D39|nr:hypothetical protein [Pararhizobium sp. IMCC3301]